MMTAEAFLKAVEKIGEVTTVFSYPYVKIVVSSEKFTDLDDSDRESTIAELVGISIGELRQIASNNLMMLRPVAPGEALDFSSTRSTHWLAGLTGSSPVKNKDSKINTIHFYGYKGGQARSTVLGEMALTLAKDGWRVLVVDADIEAPSLDTIFSGSSGVLSSTLLGVSQNAQLIKPITVYVPSGENNGTVDLINCWPKGSSYSIDAAAFALRTALEPTILERTITRIQQFAIEEAYDAILVDHRTGISPSTLPVISSMPGRVVIAIRLDEQWQSAKHFLRLVMATSSPEPGLFVVWKSDNEDLRSFSQRTFRQREDLLEMLAELFIQNDDDEESEISGADIADHIVVWPYDSAFRTQRLPEPETIDGANREALARLRSLLRLGQPQLKGKREKKKVFDISGAKDEGDLIVTKALRELLAPASPYSYVLGRKGTGKTRLARELSKRDLGELLLVSNDSAEGYGIQAASPEIGDAVQQCLNDPTRFWLALINAAIQLGSTERTNLMKEFARQIALNQTGTEIIASWEKLTSPRIFLLDSLETTFASKYMPIYLDSLFRVLSMIEADPRISEHVKFKLFLRRDLAQPGFVQNIEQQLYGKTLELSWDYQSILNFMLSRIGQNTWFENHFPDLHQRISTSDPSIREGKLSSLDCENILMEAFPSSVRRNNLSITTFFRAYFADSASERAPSDSPSNDDVRRYYPRVFDDFLREIAGDLKDQRGNELPAIEEGKIHQQRLFRAHEAAASNYLLGLKQELAYLLSLSDDIGENQALINRLLNAFDGRQTPFRVDDIVRELADSTGIPAESVRQGLDRMKEVGMFESRPDYPGEWRVGRLFKSSLRMKYVRGKAQQAQGG